MPRWVLKVFTGTVVEVEDAVSQWIAWHDGRSEVLVRAADWQAWYAEHEYVFMCKSSGELMLTLTPSVTLLNGSPHLTVAALALVHRDTGEES